MTCWNPVSSLTTFSKRKKLLELESASSPRIIPAHCSELIAPVPESVRRSISTLADASRKRLYPAFLRKPARSSRDVKRIGSTVLILNGSMIVLEEPGIVMLIERSRLQGRPALRDPMVRARARLLPLRLEPLADPREAVVNGHLGDPVEPSAVGDLPSRPSRRLVVSSHLG